MTAGEALWRVDIVERHLISMCIGCRELLSGDGCASPAATRTSCQEEILVYDIRKNKVRVAAPLQRLGPARVVFVEPRASGVPTVIWIVPGGSLWRAATEHLHHNIYECHWRHDTNTSDDHEVAVCGLGRTNQFFVSTNGGNGSW